MSEEADDFDNELTELSQHIEGEIESLRRKKKGKQIPGFEEKVAHLLDRIERAKKCLQQLKIEIRDLTPVQQDVYNKKCKEHKDNINRFIQDLNWIQESEESAEAASGKAPPKPKDVDEMTSDQVLQIATKKQDESLEATKRMKQRIEESRDVGAAAGEELTIQREKLEEIHTGVKEVQINMKMANRQLRAFVRRMATDKIFMGFLIIIVLGILAVIIVKIVQKKGTPSFTGDVFGS